MHNSFYIGNTEFCLDSECPVLFSDEIAEYTRWVSKVTRKVVYHIQFQKTIMPIGFRFLADIDYPPQIIGRSTQGECRIYKNINSDIPVAIYKEVANNNIELLLFKKEPDILIVDLEFLNYMALERQMILGKNMILHSSCVIVNNKAILFTAPSGVGKSTQADLWQQYRNAMILNGDRNLLIRMESGWGVAGFPFSGSSHINKNNLYNIEAVVAIYQSKKNYGQDCSVSDAYKKLYSEIIKNYWDQEYELNVLKLLEDFVSSVRTIQFGCNMEKAAVEYLELLLKTAR